MIYVWLGRGHDFDERYEVLSSKNGTHALRRLYQDGTPGGWFDLPVEDVDRYTANKSWVPDIESLPEGF